MHNVSIRAESEVPAVSYMIRWFKYFKQLDGLSILVAFEYIVHFKSYLEMLSVPFVLFIPEADKNSIRNIFVLNGMSTNTAICLKICYLCYPEKSQCRVSDYNVRGIIIMHLFSEY